MGRRRATATDDEQEPRRHPTTISRPTTTPDDKDKQITGTTQGKAAGDSENATSHRPQEPRPSKQGREDEPERRTHGKQRERRKSRRQPTPSTRPTTSNIHERNRSAASHAPPRQATGNSDRGEPRPRRKPNLPAPLVEQTGSRTIRRQGETNSKQARQRHRRKTRTRGTGQARQDEATTAREATGQRTTDDDAPPGMSKERGEGRDENEPAGLSNSFSSFIGPRAEPSYPSSTPRRFRQLTANRKRHEGTQRSSYRSYEIRKPDKRVGK